MLGGTRKNKRKGRGKIGLRQRTTKMVEVDMTERKNSNSPKKQKSNKKKGIIKQKKITTNKKPVNFTFIQALANKDKDNKYKMNTQLGEEIKKQINSIYFPLYDKKNKTVNNQLPIDKILDGIKNINKIIYENKKNMTQDLSKLDNIANEYIQTLKSHNLYLLRKSKEDSSPEYKKNYSEDDLGDLISKFKKFN